METNISPIITAIISIITAVLGWIVGYCLNLKAQRKAFLDQIINNARIEINESLKDYQTWLIDIENIASNIWSCLYSISSKINDSDQMQNTFKKTMDKREATKWITTLEEYEVLFPESKTVRIELLERHEEIKKSLRSHAGNPKCALDKKLISDQIALIEDLRIYFQIKCLGKITGNKKPERVVIDKTLPCIRLVNGQLSIIKASSVQKNNLT